MSRIVTVSHDRNGYVWDLDVKQNKWIPTLVILKLNRAATGVEWSPDKTKFIVTAAQKKCMCCGYNQENRWWQAYPLATGSPTSVCARWMADSVHLVCVTTARHCHLFTISPAEVDESGKRIKKDKKTKKPLEEITKWSSQGWANCCAVSPGGNWIAFASQDSRIKFIKLEKPVLSTDQPIHEDGTRDDPKEAFEQDISVNGLPLLSAQFLSETCLIGGGFDCQPRLFWLNGEKWEDLGLVDVQDVREAAQAPAAALTGSFRAGMAAFGKQEVKFDTLHSNVILQVRLCPGAFTTCGNDGKIGVWPLEAIKKHFAGKNLGI